MNEVSKRNFGFTLVELIVAIGVMAILGVIFTNTLTQTLRGQNKVKVLNQVKQNGQVILDRISSDIQQAEKVVCVGAENGGSTNDTLVVVKGGIYSRYRFYPPTSGTNGYIDRNDFTNEDIVADNPDLCTDPGYRGLNNVFTLTDRDSLNGVSLNFGLDSLGNSPIFSVSNQDGYNQTVMIVFRVFQGVKTGQSFESVVGQDGILFATAVQARGGK